MTRAMARAAALCALCTAALSGQAPRRLAGASDSVSRALADAVLKYGGTLSMLATMHATSDPQLVSGRLPTSLQGGLWVPSGATVLGGVESSRATLAVVRSSIPIDSLLAAYRREEPQLGWTVPPPAPPSRIAMGFVAPAQPLRLPNAAVFCRDRNTLTLEIDDDGEQRTINAFMLNLPMGGSDTCNPPANPSRPGSAPAFLHNFPTLTNPSGAERDARSQCVSWNGSADAGRTRLETSMTTDEIFDFYGKQLVDAGWTASPETQIASRAWTKQDSTHGRVEVTLVQTRRPERPGCIDVEMQVKNRDGR